MLIAHAASTCDVCLEGYREDCSYHSIPCGHVFCLPCLVSTSPPRCPLCRHDFTPHSMRRVHLTLPSARDLAARRLELKLVQSSPEMTLVESLVLFQEVQEWLDGEAQDEFLVLRAFAAVMCGFHETKDKLLQTEARAQKNEAALLRSLEEARSATNADGVDYKAKYEAATSELATLRAECADLHTQAEHAQRLNSEIHAHYAQAQLHVQSLSESEKLAHRTSNPLPTPPRPIEIPFLKLNEMHSSSGSQPSKGKAKDSAPTKVSETDADPMASAFVPTLSSITRKFSSNVDGRSEVTTLVFKPPKRIPVWDSPNTSYARLDAPANVPPYKHSEPTANTGSHSHAIDQTEYPNTDERPTVETLNTPSGRTRTQSDHATLRPVVQGTGQASLSTDLLSRGPHPQTRASLNDEHNSRPPAAPAPSVSYSSSPRSTSLAAWEVAAAPLTRSTLPGTSRPRDPRLIERANTISGVHLRRVSHPVVMAADTDARARSSDVSVPFPSRESKQRGDRRVVPPRTDTRVVDGSLSDASAERAHRWRHAFPSQNDSSQQQMGVRTSDVDTRRSEVQTEHLPSRTRGAMDIPPSVTVNGTHTRHETRHSDYGEHDPVMPYSRSLASHGHPDAHRTSPPTTTRERAHSLSYSYHSPALPVNHPQLARG